MVDSHAHLTEDRLLPDAERVMQRARAAGVEAVISLGTTLADSEAAVHLAHRVPAVWAAVGIHPHSADSSNARALGQLRSLAAEPRVVAIGETGLDFHYDNAPRPAQRAALVAHLDLAQELDLPAVVHCRDADGELRAVLRDAQGTRGVLHCFGGGRALLDDALAVGWYISFAGMITFRRYGQEDMVRAVPNDRILVETDSPYLAPVPLRGKRNEPAFLVHTARRAAEIRGQDPAYFAGLTAANARDLFRLAMSD